MSLTQFKRLNLISSFETQVDAELRQEFHDLRFRYNGYEGFAILLNQDLNGPELKYIVDHYNSRKYYFTAFIDASELIAPRPGFRYLNFYKDTYKTLVQRGALKKGDKYFMLVKTL